METRCISSDRETILRILERETGETAREGGPPGFSVTVGGFALLRDGRLTAGEEGARVFPLLAGLGLCDWPWAPATLPPETILCPMAGWDGGSLRNLLAILSARQVLLNKALAAKGAFFVAPSLMRSLAAHPPETAVELLRALWGREEELRGVALDRERVALTGFLGCRREEDAVHRQLAACIWDTARTQKWVKPFTPRVRNQKYAFKAWLYTVGMDGPAHEEARRILLGRLPGTTARRSMAPRREEARRG